MTNSTTHRSQPPGPSASHRGAGRRLSDLLLMLLAAAIGVGLILQVVVALVSALAPIAAYAVVIVALLIVALVLLAAHMLL
jgi:hypothetical protein